MSNRTRDGASDGAPISGFGFSEALRADKKFKLVDANVWHVGHHPAAGDDLVRKSASADSLRNCALRSPSSSTSTTVAHFNRP